MTKLGVTYIDKIWLHTITLTDNRTGWFVETTKEKNERKDKNEKWKEKWIKKSYRVSQNLPQICTNLKTMILPEDPSDREQAFNSRKLE